MQDGAELGERSGVEVDMGVLPTADVAGQLQIGALGKLFAAAATG